jgi:Sulfotransferase family
MQPFPFIVGCGRSGTTLLRAMLDSHPDVAVPPESHFIPKLIRIPLGDVGAELAGNDRFQRWGVPAETVSGTTDLAGAVRSLYARYADQRGKSRWGDKTGSYAEHMAQIGSLLPESVFVHIVRDGRDVALSFFDASFGPSTPEEAATHWRNRVTMARASGGELGTERYLEVSYESLVAEPESALRQMCEFIDVPYDPLMLDYPARANDVLAGIKAPDAHQRLRQPPTVLRDWRTQMTSDDAMRFQAVAGPTLVTMGYEAFGTET